MADGTEQPSKIVYLTQHLHQLHLTLADRIIESEADEITALETAVSRESACSLADAAVQLMLVASTLQLIIEDLASDRGAELSRAKRLVLSALRLLGKAEPKVLADCGIDYFIGKESWTDSAERKQA